MNNECGIVRDLLPSYIDEICSEVSIRFVDKHIESCDTCKKILENMEREIHIADEMNKSERLKEKQSFTRLSNFLKDLNKFTSYVLVFSLISLFLGALFLYNSILEMNEYKEEVKSLEVVEQEKGVIMNKVFNILDSPTRFSEREREQLLGVFDLYQEKLNYLAVFPAREIEIWLEEHAAVKKEPTTIYPIDYNNALLVIGSEGVVDNKEIIIPSTYDKGNVVMANEDWVVQYEYSGSYESTIEKHLQAKHYGPTNLSFFQLPIIFFIIFMLLGVVWFILQKHNKKLDGDILT
ncbi:zf-HC2 domain-containing protein [Bacillus sp. SCS-151]|uniref:zf-HC2 domain-containing protein n=1 Tax=Nanhaiella sioensis TaxID=3115293 RepID=UPI003977F13F